MPRRFGGKFVLAVNETHENDPVIRSIPEDENFERYDQSLAHPHPVLRSARNARYRSLGWIIIHPALPPFPQPHPTRS